MPLGLLIIGALLTVSALRGTERDLGALIAKDFTGTGNFGYWIAALAIIGGLGYVPAIAGPSRALMALIVVSFLLANGKGFFDQLNNALSAGPPAKAASVKPETPVKEPPHVVLEQTGGAGGIGGAIGGAVTKGITSAITSGIGGLF